MVMLNFMQVYSWLNDLICAYIILKLCFYFSHLDFAMLNINLVLFALKTFSRYINLNSPNKKRKLDTLLTGNPPKTSTYPLHFLRYTHSSSEHPLSSSFFIEGIRRQNWPRSNKNWNNIKWKGEKEKRTTTTSPIQIDVFFAFLWS
jgi:hypothetical protein